MDFLDSLNQQQRAAVEYVDGASLVIAGAGSGKTRVLTYKIAHLISLGMQPWQIMALTFTNKAADEMKVRIAQLVGEDKARYVVMGTFHSIFARILRREAQSIGYEPNYTIYDELDSRQLIKQIVKDLQLDDKIYKPSLIQSHISMAKNFLVLPEDYARHNAYVKRDKETKIPHTAEIYATYQHRLQRSNAMDFDDLLVNTCLLFDHNPDIRQRYADHYHFVLVDEYQDTNYVQQCILLQLTNERQRVCVVGDDAQSIYAFRGANIDNILGFQQQYQQTKLFKLERNYRSSQTIVKAANSLIEHNERQIKKDVYSEEGQGTPITIHGCEDDKEEAAYVCRSMIQLHKQKHISYNDIVVLYRTHAQSRLFEDQLRKQHIQYRIYGGTSFYQRKEVKDIMAYLRLTCNLHDEESLRRIINYPTRGIGNTTINKIVEAARTNNITLWDVLQDDVLHTLPANKATITKLSDFRDLILSFVDLTKGKDAYEVGQHIVQVSGSAQDLMTDATVEGLARVENMQEMLTSMHEFVEKALKDETSTTLESFLQEAALRTDNDQLVDADEEAVTLMTVHSAKGLEYDAVFIVGMEENIFPSQRALFSLRELEEERRLLYVALTRAKSYCWLTYAQNRFRYGNTEFNRPSRFLNEIDPTYVQQKSLPVSDSLFHQSRAALPPRRWRPLSSVLGQKNTTTPDAVLTLSERKQMVRNAATAESPYKKGMRVQHSRFGEGSVLHCEGTGENTKVKVAFDRVGEKQLLAKFAKLVILS